MKHVYHTKIESIQFLRALAVALVVYTHIMDSPLSNNSVQKNYMFLENWGAIGLDLFYIISGFIMTIVTPSYIQSGNWKDFITKRIVRVIPLYWVLSMLSFSLSTIKGTAPHAEKIWKTILFLPVSGSEFIFPVIPVGWSLSLEVYFYILIAILIKTAGKNIFHYLVGILLLLALAGNFSNPQNHVLKFLFSPLLTEFAFGIMAGLIFKQITAENTPASLKTKICAILLTTGGFALMACSIFTDCLAISEAALVSENSRLAFLRVLVWGVPCMFFLTGFVLLEQLFNFKIPRLFSKLGDSSYSCYLIHTLLLIPLSMKLFSYSGINNSDLFIILTLIFTLGGSLVFYNFFERKLNNILSKAFQAKRITSQIFKTESKGGFFIKKIVSIFRNAS